MQNGCMSSPNSQKQILIQNSQMHFTWETSNLCIIFNGWHIRTTAGLIFSLIAVALLTAGYEALREGSRRYECYVEKHREDLPSTSFYISIFLTKKNTVLLVAVKLRFGFFANQDDDDTERTPFLWTGRQQVEVSKRAHVLKAVLYGVQVFYSFFIM